MPMGANAILVQQGATFVMTAILINRYGFHALGMEWSNRRNFGLAKKGINRWTQNKQSDS
ncbi:MAG TPA: hypothetical protein VJS85_07550 [Rhizomicrobium sp.]|nr:hypothetical protein [Rhizomicrobium sp.]